MSPTRLFSLLVVFSLLFSTQLVNAQSEQPINVISDAEFHDLGTLESELDQTLAKHYPEWASYTQTVSWSTQPAKLGEIIVAASLDEYSNLQINPAVTLVVFGESVQWELPSNTDLYLKSQEISTELNRLSLDWEDTQNESLRSQYPEVANSGTYALYGFFNFNLERLQTWQQTYRGLFGEEVPLASRADTGLLEASAAVPEPFLRLPFDQPDATTSFWTVNSFVDHDYPFGTTAEEAAQAPDSVNTLLRFDGMNIVADPAHEIFVRLEDCDAALTCYSSHDAIDYNLDDGEPILAAAAGTVRNWDKDTNTIYILHTNGLLTIYMHMRAVYVDPNDVTKNTVNQGDVIGEAGEKGSFSGVHLHFGVRQNDHRWKDIDPFGWWSLDPDPWSTYTKYGQTSKWLWKGDEAGDGYLTVDNRESQAQLFLPPSSNPPAPPQIGWHHLASGYQGDAWYSFMHRLTDDLHKYWAIWGSTIEQPGEYVVQAYWPDDPNSGDEWLPASNAKYTLYYHQNGVLQKALLYGNQTVGTNQFNTLCKIELTGSNCPEDQIARFTFDQGSTALFLSNQAVYDASQHQRILFYDAVRWEPYTPPIPTVPPTPAGPRGFYPNGIHVKYYNDVPPVQYFLDQPINWNTFTTLAAEGDVQKIDFVWNTNPPAPNVNGIFWSARYEGQLLVPQGGDWVFHLDNLDDGGRLYIDGVKLIESWLVQGPHFYSATIPLTAGQHAIKVEYAQGPGSQGSISVAWELPGALPKEIIGPASIATSTPTRTPTLTRTPTRTPTTRPPNTPTPSCDWWEYWFDVCLSSSMNVASNSLQETVLNVQLFYRVRDELLNLTPEGSELTNLYYKHGPEIGSLLMNNPTLEQQGLALLEYWEPKLQALLDGQGNTVSISQQEVDAIEQFLSGLAALGSDPLNAAIESEMANLNLQGLVGKTMSQAWDQINGVATATSTPTYTPTPTPTNTPTPTPTVSSSFPATGILDNFNRANGSIGSNWSGNTSSYNIYANKLLVKSRNSNLDIYWKNTSFGPNQEAYFTFSSVNNTAIDQDLILKGQSMSGWGDGMIVIQYDALTHNVIVWTYDHMQSWVEYAPIPVTFVNGDQFGARALSNGVVEIYRNGTLLATRNISAWPHNSKGGYLGLWFGNAKDAQIDDFGGGTIP